MSILRRVRERPRLWAAVAAAGLGLLVFVLVWFQPQRLLYDTVVDEEFPGSGAATADDPATTDDPGAAPSAPMTDEGDPDGENGEPAMEEPATPRALATGTFSSRNRYTVVGHATVYEVEDGTRVLRLEDFSSTNGPDLYVYLTAADEADGDDALDTDFIDLGRLTGNIGNQNYDIPDGIDLDRYDTVVIWCLRFTVSFGAADLSPTQG
jgi:hypothetical protein